MFGLTTPLPKYSGPYHVSTTELEIPCKHQEFGNGFLKRTGINALQLDTVQALVFYPADADPHRKQGQSRQPWVSRPLSATAQGYAAFVGAPSWLLKIGILFAAGIKLPVQSNVPLAAATTKPAPPSPAASETATVVDDTEAHDRSAKDETAKLRSPSNTGEFPLVIFSHGLGGTRTTYSQYCGELASLGYIVAAIEHRDGSGPATVVRSPDSKNNRTVLYINQDDLEFRPPSSKVSQLEYRKQQLEMRYAEVRETLRVFERISNGDGAAVARENLRKTRGSESLLDDWNGRIDMDRVVMAGHSFGGATALQMSSSAPFKRCIALDPWIDPLPKVNALERFTSPASDRAVDAKPSATPTAHLEVKVPLLTINSESFTLWKVHFNSVSDIVNSATKVKAWFITLVGSVHMSFSDFPLLSPFVSRKAGSRVDPKLAMHKFTEATREFLLDEDDGPILGQKVQPGDERGARPGEGKGEGKHPMQEVGDMRMHIRPSSAHARL